MRLTNKAIQELRSNMRLRNRLALELDKSHSTLNRWISDNDDNLTKAAALVIIREETGLDDSQILEETEVENRA